MEPITHVPSHAKSTAQRSLTRRFFSAGRYLQRLSECSRPKISKQHDRFVERCCSPVSIGGFHFEVPYDVSCEGGDDALVAKWVKLSDIEDGKIHLGFGHPYWLSRAFPDNKKLQVLFLAAEQNIQAFKKMVNEVRKTKGRNEIP